MLDLVDEDLGELVLVAVEEYLRQVVVGVDAGGQDDVEAALVGHALAEGGVAVEKHRAGLDHGRTPWDLTALASAIAASHSAASS